MSKGLFNYKNVSNNVHRSAFDLSKRNLFTAKVGELLPVYHKRVMPGDKFKINIKSFTRTMPVNTAAFSRVKEYFDFFFVPYRLLWRNAPQSFTMINSNPQYANSIVDDQQISQQLPYMNMDDVKKYLQLINSASYVDEVGYERCETTCKLLNYLGYYQWEKDDTGNYVPSYPTAPGTYTKAIKNLSLMPLLSYQKIYNDFYRNMQWQEAQPSTYNVDYLTNNSRLVPPTSGSNFTKFVSSPNMFNLRYANYGKDLLMGLLPSQQFGEVSQVSAQGVEATSGTMYVNLKARNDRGQEISTEIIGGSSVYTGVNNPDHINVTGSVPYTADGVTSKFDILQLRTASAMQKWKEITQCADYDYRQQVKKHFGVDMPKELDNKALFLGGSQGTITINEVVNTNLAQDEQSDIKGKGTGSVDGYINFEAKEHGIIMCIYHAVPQVDYLLNGAKRELTSIDITDQAIPELDSIGLEPVTVGEFFSDKSHDRLTNETIGYAPRYYSYKTDLDEVNGEFRKSLIHWCTPFDSLVDSNGQLLNVADLMKIRPNIMDTIFPLQATASTATDNLLVGSYFDVKVVRNLDFNGMPY